MFGIPDVGEMSDIEFSKFSVLINDLIGIHMPENKKYMLQSRLQRRVRDLSFETYTEYYNHLLTPKGHDDEAKLFINMVTTNKTDFFREKKHFDFLSSTLLPEFKASNNNTFKIWSAACSSGEEPYTMGIVLDQYKIKEGGVDFQIYASDISTEVLGKAEKGIYRADIVSPIPDALRSKYFLAGNNDRDFFYKVKDELKAKIKFSRQNLMADKYGIPDNLDALFCRNVLIYFEKPTKIEILTKLISHLKPGGHLFLGHTETVFGMKLPVESRVPAVYRKL